MCVCFELCLGYLGCKANLTLASIEFWAMASHMEFLRTLGTVTLLLVCNCVVSSFAFDVAEIN